MYVYLGEILLELSLSFPLSLFDDISGELAVSVTLVSTCFLSCASRGTGIGAVAMEGGGTEPGGAARGGAGEGEGEWLLLLSLGQRLSCPGSVRKPSSWGL